MHARKWTHTCQTLEWDRRVWLFDRLGIISSSCCPRPAAKPPRSRAVNARLRALGRHHAASSALTISRLPSASSASLMRGQFCGVARCEVEHSPHLLVTLEFSRQAHIRNARLSHGEIECRFCSHGCRDGNQPLAPDRFGWLWDLATIGNPSGNRLLRSRPLARVHPFRPSPA